jgi:hypothetical protein
MYIPEAPEKRGYGNSRTSRRRDVILFRFKKRKQAVRGLRGFLIVKRSGIKWDRGPHEFRSLPAHVFRVSLKRTGGKPTSSYSGL